MRRTLSAGASSVSLLLVAAMAAGAEGGGLERHAGTLHSLRPAHGVLAIEESGANGQTELVEIQIRDADVVRIWRDPTRPWEWRERSTKLHRWTAGTFVVVIGRQDRSGVINAQRVEIPRIERDGKERQRHEPGRH